ncbi:MAG: tetratricopeptide repeat protein [Pyrinomonadaceae bacterium]
MTKNILLTVVGTILGFMLGFLAANSFSKALTPPGIVAETMSPATPPAAAPPLDPAQTSGKLPPNHPNISGDAATADGATTAGATNITANSAQAQSAMDQADRQPRSFDAQMSAAAVFYQAGAFDKAALYLSRALAINPNNADALTAMGDTKYDAGDYTSAASFYERSLAQRPNDVDVRTDLGNTYFQRTPPDFDRAINEYRKALQLDPKHEKTLQNLAAAALRKGDKQIARDAVEKLASVNPSNQFVARMRAALESNSTP